ncbi:MAG TPA: LLM class flavin-dependent oxidoreductase [Mycobacterium sp.]|nr:LLM class flavin-dependent oxidoreductase [Mycobacterium sp.]
MDFGLCLLNQPGCWDDAAFAEQHGFASAGFVDSPVICGDPFVAMALTAKSTSTMKLGTLLNIPSMRSATSTASALTSLNQIAPGRVFFGTGTGYTGRGAMGLPPMAASKVRDYMCEVKELMAGREVMHKHDGRETAVRMTDSDQIRNNLDNPVPAYMAADGPKALKTAGAHADGWIATLQPCSVMNDAPEVFERSLGAVRAAAGEHGRNFDGAYTIWTTAVCILEPGESAISPRALQHTGPIAMFAFHSYACNPEIAQFFPPHVCERLDIYEREVLSRLDVSRERFYQAVHAGHLSYLLDGEAAVLTEQIVRDISLTGTADEVADRLGRMEAAGLKNVSLCIPPGVFRESVLSVEEQLMPLMAPAVA